MPPRNALVSPSERGPLGQYLWDLRQGAGLSLREVEEASGVSNPYVSQLETGKITKPSPDILFRLAEVYSAQLPAAARAACSYERMMELAGHIVPKKESGRRRGRLPTFATETLTADEEEELLKYLAFIRMRKGKP